MVTEGLTDIHQPHQSVLLKFAEATMIHGRFVEVIYPQLVMAIRIECLLFPPEREARIAPTSAVCWCRLDQSVRLATGSLTGRSFIAVHEHRKLLMNIPD